MDIKERLARHFEAERSGPSVGHTPVEEIIRTGDLRTRRRRAVVSGGAALSVALALGVGSLAFRGDFDSPTNPNVAQSTAVTSVADGAAATVADGPEAEAEIAGGDERPLGDLKLDWVGQPGVLQRPFESTGFGGALYVVSSAPGARQEPDRQLEKALYSSTVPGVWDVTEFGTEVYPTGVSANQHGVYVVGTVPGVTDPADFEVAVRQSTDGGRSFSSTELAAGLAIPELSSQICPSCPVSDVYADIVAAVASSVDSTVVLASVTHWLDLTALAPVLGVEEGAMDWVVVDGGIELLDFSRYNELAEVCEHAMAAQGADSPEGIEECDALETDDATLVSTFYPWADLGMDEPQLHRSVIYASRDGGEFVPVADPPAGRLVELVSTGSGFVVLATDEFPSMTEPVENHLYWSADGVAWELVDVGSRVDSILDAGEVGGTPVVATASYEAPGAVRVFTLDGAVWSELPLPPVFGGDGWLGWGAAGEVGPLGLALVVSWSPPPERDQGAPEVEEPAMQRMLLVTSDLVEWSVADVDELLATAIGAPGAHVGDPDVLMYEAGLSLVGSRWDEQNNLDVYEVIGRP